MRPSGRAQNELRPINITRHFTKYAEGSALIEFGNTKVICTASIVPGVPRFLKGTNQGWLTSEYGMLPRSTHERMDREAYRGKQSGRTLEIQRLIGRSLRAVVDLKGIGENTIHMDCDVIQADGGTRTASITGVCIALYDALLPLQNSGKLQQNPFKQLVAAVSVGMYQNNPVVDLDYQEDCQAETDMNLVMCEDGRFIEVQGTAEGAPFDQQQLQGMLEIGAASINKLFAYQRAALGIK